jgi:hypothetical protein
MSRMFRRFPAASMWLAIAAIGAVAVSTIVAPGVAQAKTKRDLTVMTQNLYLGSSLQPALEATTEEEFVAAVATIYGTMQFTNFPARAGAIADEVSANIPDMIGLQEVSNWTAFRVGPGTSPPSYDFLDILESAVDSEGLHYSAAAVSTNADVGPVPLIAPAYGCVSIPDCFVSFLDRDVILVNDDNSSLHVSNPQSGNYATQEIFHTVAGDISFDRGWVSVDGTLAGKAFHMANTHLETEDFPVVQEAQAREFLAGPAKGVGAVIATGDFNSAADGSTTATYGILTKSYFQDVWTANPQDPGLSCCQNATLTNAVSELTTRIDLVLTRAATRALDAPAPHLIGDSPFEAVPPLWPSDHAGVVATVRLH